MFYDDRKRDKNDYNNMLQGLYPFEDDGWDKISSMIFECNSHEQAKRYIFDKDLFSTILQAQKQCATFKSVFSEWGKTLK